MKEFINGEYIREKLQEEIDKIDEFLLVKPELSDSTRAQMKGQQQGFVMSRNIIHEELKEVAKENAKWDNPQSIPLF